MESLTQDPAKINVLDHPASRIENVWTLLGGGEIRRGRARAFFRDGDGWSLSIDPEKNTYFDFVEGSGGGVLDLVRRVHGGSRSEAANWLRGELGITETYTPAPLPTAAAMTDADKVIDWRVGRAIQLDAIKRAAANDEELEPAARALYLLEQAPPSEWFDLCVTHWLDAPQQAELAEAYGRGSREFVEWCGEMVRRNHEGQ